MPIFLDPYGSGDATVTLSNNMKVTVRIAAGALVTADGVYNSARLERTFITVSSPIYADVDYIIVNGGEWMEAVPEAAIYAMSYAASTLVDDIVLFDPAVKFPDQTTMGWKFFNRARTEFVKYKVSADILRAVTTTKGTSGARKMLADFSIDNASLAGLMTQARPMIKEYIECYQYWQKVLFAGGAVDFESPMGQVGVKGGNLYDGFGGIGRSWIPDSDNLSYKEPEVPTGNTMSRPRRFGNRNPMAGWHES